MSPRAGLSWFEPVDPAFDDGEAVVPDCGALSLYQESLSHLAGVPSVSGWVVGTLAGIASVLAERGLDDDAAKLWGAVCAAEQTLAFRLIGAERRRYETRLARLEQTAAWLAGQRLTLEEAAAAIPAGA